MTGRVDWEKRQAECRKCQGIGYRQSEATHESGRGKAWAALCECQPSTFAELEEAAAQERQVKDGPTGRT